MSHSDSTHCGEIEIRPNERTVLAGGRVVALTPREFEIVGHMAEHPGWVFSCDQLSDGPASDDDFSIESVSVHISRLRHKLADAGVIDAIETVRGFGYRLRGIDSEATAKAACGDQSLRDAFWELDETVMLAEHEGTDRVRAVAIRALEDARLAIRTVLARESGADG